MGYSKSIVTLERRLSLLTELLSEDEVIWKTEPKNERLLAYQIREALAVAKTIGATKYPEYAEAARAFTIQETGIGKVIARRHTATVSAITEKPSGFKVKNTVEDLMDDFDPSNPFTTVKLIEPPNTTDLTDLATWLKSQGFLLFWNDETELVTIKHFSEELEPLAFDAEDLE